MSFSGDSIFWVEVEKIVPNPYQPRREFDESKLNELAESIRMYGVLQPLTVTRKEVEREDGTFYSEYELIAGERRLRASKVADLKQVPVIIRDGEQSEQEKLELAIIENLQREDLNAVDRALAFRQLADQFGLSHAKVAKKVGRSREYVSNTIRLLGLPDYMLNSLRLSDISEGHARTLLMLNDRAEEQDTIYREILLKKLSVRELERIVRKMASDKVRKKDWKHTDPELIEMEKQFTDALGTRVQIAKTDFGGKLTIDYFSNDDLTELLVLLKREEGSGMSPMQAMSSLADIAADSDRLRESTPLEMVEEIQSDSEFESVEENAIPEAEYEEAVIKVIGPTTPLPEFLVSAFKSEVVRATESDLFNPTEEVSSDSEVLDVNNVTNESDTEQSFGGSEILEEVEEGNESSNEISPAEEDTLPPVSNREDGQDESQLYTIRNFSI